MIPVNVTGPATGPRGRMTAVMRAVRPPTGPRVLRIGLVVGSRIVDERIVKQRAHVTVGTGEDSTFVVHAHVPAAFRLFERTGDDYVLHVLPGMIGRVALPSGVVDLATVRSLLLTEDARGRISIGEATFLFQFVDPPLAPTRPRLPLAVKGGLASAIDWRLTVIAAFSFLGHFGLVGALYSDWADPVVDEDVTARLIETTPVTPPEPSTNETADPAAPSAVATPAEARPFASPAPRPRPAGPETPAAAATPRGVQDLVDSVDRTRIEILTALDPGSALAVATSHTSEGAPVDLDKLAERAEGFTNANLGGLHLPSGSAPIVAQHDLDLGTLGTIGPAASTAGTARPIAPPSVDVEYHPPTMSAPVANAEAVLRSAIFPGARRCYQKGLASDASQAGRLVLQIAIAPNGEVSAATATSSGGLSAGVVQCVERVARRARFEAPGPQGSTLGIPFNFVRQGG